MRRAAAENLVVLGRLAQRLEALGVGDKEVRHLEGGLAEVGEAAKPWRCAVTLYDIARDGLTRNRTFGGDAARDVAVLVEIVALVEINEDLPRLLDARVEEAISEEDARGLAPHRLNASRAAKSETHHVAPGEAMQDMRRVHELRAVTVRGEQPVALPFRIRVTEQRDVIVRRGVGLGGLREYFRDVGEMRMQIEREMREEEAEDNKARDQPGHADRNKEQQRIGERRTKRRTHAAFSPNAPSKSMEQRSLLFGCRLVPLFGDAGKLGAELFRVDAVRTHDRIDERVIEH